MTSPILGEQVRKQTQSYKIAQLRPPSSCSMEAVEGGWRGAQARLLLRNLYCEMSKWNPGGSAGLGLAPMSFLHMTPPNTIHIWEVLYIHYLYHCLDEIPNKEM